MTPAFATGREVWTLRLQNYLLTVQVVPQFLIASVRSKTNYPTIVRVLVTAPLVFPTTEESHRFLLRGTPLQANLYIQDWQQPTGLILAMK